MIRSLVPPGRSPAKDSSALHRKASSVRTASPTDDVLLLQRMLGNARFSRLVQQPGTGSLQRHSEDEEAKGVRADDEGTPVEEEEAPVQRRVDTNMVQRVKDTATVKAAFDDVLNQKGKTAAANYLKKKYDLDTKPYALSVDALPKASTHASTGGGWSGKTFNAIRVRVNEPYLDRQAQSDDGFNKLIHTLAHEYQHVKQRSKKGWQTTGDASAKGEREFLAYSFEVLDAGSKKGMAPLAKAEMASTIKKALNYYGQMSQALQTKHTKRHEKLLNVQVLNNW